MRPYIVSCLALLTVGCTTFADLGQREPTRTGSMPGSARPLAACAVDAMEARNSFFHSGIYSLRDIEHGARVRVAAQSSVPMLEATLVDTQGTVTVETRRTQALGVYELEEQFWGALTACSTKSSAAK